MKRRKVTSEAWSIILGKIFLTYSHETKKSLLFTHKQQKSSCHKIHSLGITLGNKEKMLAKKGGIYMETMGIPGQTRKKKRKKKERKKRKKKKMKEK